MKNVYMKNYRVIIMKNGFHRSVWVRATSRLAAGRQAKDDNKGYIIVAVYSAN